MGASLQPPSGSEKKNSTRGIIGAGESARRFQMKSFTAVSALTMLVVLGAQELLSLARGMLDLEVLGAELASGFRHIIPEGLDHIAFLLGLFFLSRAFPALLAQVTLFTLAHSLTLGLVVLTGFSFEPRWVEVAVGLSIAAVAMEGMFSRSLARWRWLLVIAFGMIHGLAFAHNLVQEEGIRRSPVSALFGFNLGVELGQLVVVGALMLVFSPWWRRPWYRVRVALPALACTALCGLFWAVQRAV